MVDVGIGYRKAIEGHRPGGGAVEADQDFQQRRLAAAVAALQEEQLAGLDLQRVNVHGEGLLLGGRIGEGEVVNLDAAVRVRRPGRNVGQLAVLFDLVQQLLQPGDVPDGHVGLGDVGEGLNEHRAVAQEEEKDRGDGHRLRRRHLVEARKEEEDGAEEDVEEDVRKNVGVLDAGGGAGVQDLRLDGALAQVILEEVLAHGPAHLQLLEPAEELMKAAQELVFLADGLIQVDGDRSVQPGDDDGADDDADDHHVGGEHGDGGDVDEGAEEHDGRGYALAEVAGAVHDIQRV